MSQGSTISFIDHAGAILASTVATSSNLSTNGMGPWIPLHMNVRQCGVQAILTGSSAGALVNGQVSIQASNDGVNPIASTLGLITLSSLASPASDGFTFDAHYSYIRAVLGGTTGTTMSSGSSMTVIVSPHLVK